MSWSRHRGLGRELEIDRQVDEGLHLLGRMTAVVGLVAVAAFAWRCLNGTHQRRQVARANALPPKLQTWEGEGGRPDIDEPTTTMAPPGPPLRPVAAEAPPEAARPTPVDRGTGSLH